MSSIPTTATSTSKADLKALEKEHKRREKEAEKERKKAEKEAEKERLKAEKKEAKKAEKKHKKDNADSDNGKSDTGNSHSASCVVEEEFEEDEFEEDEFEMDDEHEIADAHAHASMLIPTENDSSPATASMNTTTQAQAPEKAKPKEKAPKETSAKETSAKEKAKAPKAHKYTIRVPSSVCAGGIVQYIMTHKPVEQPRIMNSITVKPVPKEKSSARDFTFMSILSHDEIIALMQDSFDPVIVSTFHPDNLTEVFAKTRAPKV